MSAREGRPSIAPEKLLRAQVLTCTAVWFSSFNKVVWGILQQFRRHFHGDIKVKKNNSFNLRVTGDF
jgi:hypothetical protein